MQRKRHGACRADTVGADGAFRSTAPRPRAGPAKG